MISVNTTISWRGRDGATGYERAGSGDSHLLTLDYSETGPVEISVTFSSSVCNKTTITHYNGKIIFEQYSYYYYTLCSFRVKVWIFNWYFNFKFRYCLLR